MPSEVKKGDLSNFHNARVCRHYKKMQSEPTHNQQFSVGFNRFGKTTPKSRDLCYSNQHSEHLSVGFNRFGKTTAK
jgi:hypothetical protein